MSDNSVLTPGSSRKVSTAEVSATKVALNELAKWHNKFDGGKTTSLAGLLPFITKFRGKPYSLNDYFVWDYMFETKLPYLSVTKCGRQQGKSLSQAVQHSIFPAVIPYYNMLYVSPRSEQTRTFSQDNLSPILRDSPLTSHMLRHPDAIDNQLHKFFPATGSNLYCSYALDNADRIRSKTAKRVSVDEGQDIFKEVISVILEVMSAQEDASWQLTGTPKTLDNTLEYYWQKTSMAEWAIKCTACNKVNICSVDMDLLKMIPDQGLSCAKCGRLVNPRNGGYIHRYPKRRGEAEGHHVPQCVLPLHCEPILDKETREYVQNVKWRIFCKARDDGDTATFYNEKLGESYDNADLLITREDLAKASRLKFRNNLDEALAYRKRRKYTHLIMGLDWGGGGASALSRTGISIIGFRGLNRPAEVIYQHRYVGALRGIEEAAEILRVFSYFGCDFIAHDHCGAGATKEVLLVELGLPLERILPVEYVGYRRGDMITAVYADGDLNPRDKLQAVKTQTLAVMAALIQSGYYSFPLFSSWEADIAPCYTALMREKRSAKSSGPTYHIFAMPERFDDVAMSTNYASIAYFNLMGGIPPLKGIKIATERPESAMPKPNSGDEIR